MSGFQVKERPDGILIYYFEDSEKNTIDEWFNTSVAIQREYDKNHRHLRVIYQKEAIELPTPYGVSQTIRLIGLRPPTLCFSTAIVSSNLHFQMASQYISQRIPYSNHVFRVEDVQEGIAWLNERHRKHQQGLPLDG